MKDRTESIWKQEKLPEFPAISRDQEIEICVVGGGISGVSIAYQLAKRGHKVMLVEAFRIGSGQTGRTTAHLSYQLEEEFTELLKIHDEKTLSLFVEAHKTAIDVMEKIALNENISCDFKRVDGYLFQGKNISKDYLFREQESARKCGADLNFIEVTPLLQESVPSLRFPRQAQFNPMKYLAGLLRVLKDLKVTIYEGTHVQEIHQDEEDLWWLQTDRGYTINARDIVIATDSPVNNRFHIHTKQYAYRTYAMAFELSFPVKEECLLWDTESPYHYVRFVNDTLVIGGEDHRTGQEPEEDPFMALESWSRKNFSFIKDVRWRWSGQVFEPMDQIAFIGKNPGVHKNDYIATGASGIGLTSATIASLIIPDLIERGEHPWAKMFDPSRSPVRGIKDFVQENLNVAYQYTDWLRSSDINDLKKIPQDSGSVVREGFFKSCVYHDLNDHFEKKSAICPHFGGIVHWNDVEKTWDCPCHGSRFNTHGKVIEGPSLKNLAEK